MPATTRPRSRSRDGRCASPARRRSCSTSGARPSSTSSSTTSRSRTRSCARLQGGRCSCSGSRTAHRDRRSSRSVCPTTRPTGSRRRSSARRTAPTSRALVAADLAHLVWAVNLGCLGFHVWPYRAADPGHADELRLDLDPQPGVGFDGVRDRGARGEDAARRARRDRATRRRPGTAASTCTCGSSRVGTRTRSARPRSRWRASSPRRRPDVLTDAWWKEERGERVFIDFNQNAPHKTVFGAWSARARPGATGVDPVHVGRARRDPPRRPHDRDRAGPHRRERRPVGRRSTTTCSRSSRSSRCTNATSRPVSPTRRGHPSIRRCPANRRASRRAAPRSPRRSARPRRRVDGKKEG